MTEKWQRVEGTGWIDLPGFGTINPRRDNVGEAGRFFFTAMTAKGEYAKARGAEIMGGPETWQYEPDQPILLADYDGNCVEVAISLLQGGRYGVQYRPGVWPDEGSGAW